MSTLHFRQFEVAEGVIDLGLGQPDPQVYPRSLLQTAAATVLAPGRDARRDYEFLQYGAEYGDRDHRIALAEFLTTAYATAVDPEHVLTTNGNSQALDLICTVFTRPGDVIVVEEPTYFLARGIFSDHGLVVRGVPTDADGMQMDALEATLDELRSAGTPARLVYCIPASQNPTGASLTDERRRRLVAVAERFDALVVADEVYQLLHYADEPSAAPLSAQVESNRVLSLGTFSKILSPGLRLGWIHASAPLLARIVQSGVISSGGGLNPFTSALVTSIIRTGSLAVNIDMLRTVYRARLDALDAALHASMPAGVRWQRPAGGYFVWLDLPDHLDGSVVRSTCAAAQVDVRQGSLFSTVGSLAPHLRLSFAHYPADELAEGVRRLASAVVSAQGTAS